MARTGSDVKYSHFVTDYFVRSRRSSRQIRAISFCGFLASVGGDRGIGGVRVVLLLDPLRIGRLAVWQSWLLWDKIFISPINEKQHADHGHSHVEYPDFSQ